MKKELRTPEEFENRLSCDKGSHARRSIANQPNHRKHRSFDPEWIEALSEVVGDEWDRQLDILNIRR